MNKIFTLLALFSVFVHADEQNVVPTFAFGLLSGQSQMLIVMFLMALLLMVIALLLVSKKRAEQLAQEKIGNFNQLFMDIPIGLCHVSSKGEILSFNQRFKELFGYEKEDIPTLDEWWVLAYPDEEYRKWVFQRWSEAVQKSTDTGKDIEPIAYDVTCKNGNVRTMEISGTSIGLEFIATFIDLTERIKAENLLKESNEKLLGLFKLSPLGIALTDTQGKYIEFNDAFVRICGYPAEELKSLASWDLTPEKYKEQEALQLEMLEKTGQYGPYEKEYRQKDGTLIPINLNGLAIGDDDTQKYIWSIVEDISKRKDTEKISLLRHELVDLTHQKNRDVLLQYALDRAEEMTHSQIGFFHFVDEDQENVSLQVWSSNTLKKMCFAEGHSMHYPISQAGVWVDCIYERKPVIHNDYESLPHKKGMPKGHAPLIREVVVPVFKNDSIVAIIGVGNKEKEYDQHDVEIVQQIADMAYDYVERLEIERQIKHLAYYDSLTDLPNRTLLSDRLNQAIATHKRTKRYLAVCFMDLDGFKPINDQYGHQVGDKLLNALANRIGMHLREGDTFARLGGDEFVLVITEMNSPDEYIEVIERIIRVLNAPFEIDMHRIHVSCSVGITIYPTDNADADTLLRHADQAMYQAKEDLKQPYKVYKMIEDETLRTHHQFVEEFAKALEEEHLVLHYQPKVNLRDAGVIGVEALIRWQHPTRGLLFPNEFLHIVKDTPLEIKLDEWVIQKAFEQRDEFEKKSLDLTISINISPRHIQLESFSDFVCSLLSKYHLDFAKHIEFEILEVSNIENIDAVKDNMLKCSQKGATFSLDDFGTGFSSLVHFHNLPIHILKIDQNFVRDMLVDSNDLKIVEGVLNLAYTLKRPVVAEGVESIEIGLMLLYLGCQYAQGYGIAKPMPIERFYLWLDEWVKSSIWNELQQETSLDSTHYDINVAIFSHRKWLENAIDFIIHFPNSDKTPLDENNCQFEHWYKGIGKTRYGNRESFAFVQAKHNKVHQFVTHLIELAKSGQKEKAIAKIDELRANASELIKMLEELAKQ